MRRRRVGLQLNTERPRYVSPWHPLPRQVAACMERSRESESLLKALYDAPDASAVSSVLTETNNVTSVCKVCLSVEIRC